MASESIASHGFQRRTPPREFRQYRLYALLVLSLDLFIDALAATGTWDAPYNQLQTHLTDQSPSLGVFHRI
jgi:hypothetical protein